MFASSLPSARYLNLGTFRKSGVRVETPVWFALSGDILYAFSNQEAGKVKRLRNSKRCTIAPCTLTGSLQGPWQETDAFLITDPDEIKTAHHALKQKYGWQMVLLDMGAWLGRRIERRSYIRIHAPQSSQ